MLHVTSLLLLSGTSDKLVSTLVSESFVVSFGVNSFRYICCV